MMFKSLYDTFISSSPNCDVFANTTMINYGITDGQITVEGSGNMAALKFDVHGKGESFIESTLVAIPRTDLENSSLINQPKNVITRHLLSDWKILTTQNDKTVVISDEDPIGLVFTNKEGFPFDHLCQNVPSILNTRFFHELRFIAEIEKLGYSTEILKNAKVSSPDAYKRLTENIDSAIYALKILTLETILDFGQKNFTYPRCQITPIIRPSNGYHRFEIGSDVIPGWTGHVIEKFGTIEVTLSNNNQTVKGKFSKCVYLESYDHMFSNTVSNDLANSWYVSQGIFADERKMVFISPALKDAFMFNGDKDFPIKSMNSKIINYQIYHEQSLFNFSKSHYYVGDAIFKNPRWSKNKLQVLMQHLETTQKLIDQGIPLQVFEMMSEDKYCYLMNNHLSLPNATKFTSLPEIFGHEMNPEIDHDNRLYNSCKIL